MKKILLYGLAALVAASCVYPFTPDESFIPDEELVVDGKHNKLSLRLYPNAGADSTQCQVLDQKSYIEYLYTFSNDDYMII